MFRGFSQLFSKSNKDLRKRIYFTMFCLGLFCLGTTITIPWASKIYQDLHFLEIFNLMSGGGLQNFSIFALGVSPYITASIITNGYYSIFQRIERTRICWKTKNK